MDMSHLGVESSAIAAAFLASVVEVVEAFTIVLAVGTLRGWRPAWLGTFAALAVLSLMVIVLGPLLGRVPGGLLKAFHIALAFITITTAWAFIHVMFALHYAHEYFEEWRSHKDEEPQLRGGLEFIGLVGYPDYLDFAYYSFTIGVATATSDVNLTSRQMRRITLAHSILAFFSIWH